MERVAFLVDDTGERVDCLINPESFEIRRLAGVRQRTVPTRLLTGPDGDDQLLFTGGGRTEVVLDLLFDVDLVEGANRPADVRTLTARLWRLAENSGEQHGAHRPPRVRLVWGKSWNLPGVVVGIAERLDVIDAAGVPRRSWLRLKLVRSRESDASDGPTGDTTAGSAADTPVPRVSAVRATGSGERGPGYSGVRFDLLAQEALGSPHQWRALASHNDIANPLTVPAGTVLSVPGATTAGAS